MNFTPKHVISIDDLFLNFDITKLKGKGNIKRNHRCATKNALLNRIFLRYLYLLFEDFVKGGKIFIFPSNRTTSLAFNRLKRQQFINARKRGKFRDVDVLVSDFTCYEVVMNFFRHGKPNKTTVKLSSNFMQEITDKTNTGYKYC